jgi:hypothetical protein
MFWTRPPKSLQMWLSGAHIHNELSYKLSSKPILLTTTGAPQLQISLGARSEKRFQAPPPTSTCQFRYAEDLKSTTSQFLTLHTISELNVQGSAMYWRVGCTPSFKLKSCKLFGTFDQGCLKGYFGLKLTHTQHRARVSTGYELTPKRHDSANWHWKAVHIGPVWHLGVNANLWLIPWSYASTLGYIHAWLQILGHSQNAALVAIWLKCLENFTSKKVWWDFQ